MAMKARTLILRTAGTNCDLETGHAFEVAGSEPVFLHINRLLENRSLLRDFQILAIPGGFSYGDDIAAGRIFANQIVHHLHDALSEFISAAKPIIGICNGFQVLVKAGLLPGPVVEGRAGQLCTLTGNEGGRFIDRWVNLAVRSRKCIWTAGLGTLELPIAHGEGRFVPADERVREALWQRDQVVLIYAKPDGTAAGGAVEFNPNGSVDDVAGICDSTGLVFGVMPHPERYLGGLQHPAWTRRRSGGEGGAGRQVFENAVRHVGEAVGAGS
jgi:phosphoribosylformylglycinamidine synthase subunit PurQ / glutaminase